MTNNSVNCKCSDDKVNSGKESNDLSCPEKDKETSWRCNNGGPSVSCCVVHCWHLHTNMDNNHAAAWTVTNKVHFCTHVTKYLKIKRVDNTITIPYYFTGLCSRFIAFTVDFKHRLKLYDAKEMKYSIHSSVSIVYCVLLNAEEYWNIQLVISFPPSRITCWVLHSLLSTIS